MAQHTQHKESYYLMMMDALDGELAAAEKQQLESHLRTCPACQQEWNALAAIDNLFRQAPMLMPAVDFAERTVGLLPDRRARVWALSAIYSLLLLTGIVPVVIVAWALIRYSAAFAEGGMVQGVAATIGNAVQLGGTVVGALVAGAGRLVVEEPAVVGWTLLLAGSVFLWGGVIQRLLVQPQRATSRN